MLLSIIIPCYNQAHFLIEAFEGLENLPNLSFEVIIVNDGSTNELTQELIEKIIKKYESLFPIILINQKNQGLAMARNNGINISKGKYILPLDADNKAIPSFIKKAISCLEEKNGVAIVHGNPIFFGDLSDKQRQFSTGDFKIYDMLKFNYIDACAIYRREVWISNKGYDKNMPFMGQEDWLFWLEAYKNNFTFYYLNEPAYHYRILSGSMVTDITGGEKGAQNQAYVLNKILDDRIFLEIMQIHHSEISALNQKYNVLKNMLLNDLNNPLRTFFKYSLAKITNKKLSWL